MVNLWTIFEYHVKLWLWSRFTTISQSLTCIIPAHTFISKKDKIQIWKGIGPIVPYMQQAQNWALISLGIHATFSTLLLLLLLSKEVTNLPSSWVVLKKKTILGRIMHFCNSLKVQTPFFVSYYLVFTKK